jgi:hypothetical protein
MAHDALITAHPKLFDVAPLVAYPVCRPPVAHDSFSVSTVPHVPTHHPMRLPVAKLEEKWWGAKLPPLGVHKSLMLKLEGAYMVKTSQL